MHTGWRGYCSGLTERLDFKGPCACPFRGPWEDLLDLIVFQLGFSVAPLPHPSWVVEAAKNLQNRLPIGREGKRGGR